MNIMHRRESYIIHVIMAHKQRPATILSNHSVQYFIGNMIKFCSNEMHSVGPVSPCKRIMKFRNSPLATFTWVNICAKTFKKTRNLNHKVISFGIFEKGGNYLYFFLLCWSFHALSSIMEIGWNMLIHCSAMYCFLFTDNQNQISWCDNELFFHCAKILIGCLKIENLFYSWQTKLSSKLVIISLQIRSKT